MDPVASHSAHNHIFFFFLEYLSDIYEKNASFLYISSKYIRLIPAHIHPQSASVQTSTEANGTIRKHTKQASESYKSFFYVI